ncbi:MAG: ribosome maturation factor RimP [Gaiellales bacterium]|nr:ribosome maturation factor RimP [Gaiellales bacterium]
MRLNEAYVQAVVDRHMEGVEVVLVEVAGNRARRIVRVFLDHPSGVTHGLCGQLSPLVGEAIDADALVDGPYVLEVSSPGLDRPLRTPEHFAAQVGRRISLRTVQPVEGRRSWQGELVDADAESVEVVAAGHRARIPLANVARANLVYEFDRRKTE